MIKAIFSRFKKEEIKTAGLASERLHVIIASNNKQTDFGFMPKLEKEIFALIQKYIKIDNEDVDMKVEFDEQTGTKMLELNVNLENKKKK